MNLFPNPAKKPFFAAGAGPFLHAGEKVQIKGVVGANLLRKRKKKKCRPFFLSKIIVERCSKVLGS